MLIAAHKSLDLLHHGPHNAGRRQNSFGFNGVGSWGELAGQSIGFSVARTGLVRNGEIKPSREQLPPSLSGVQSLGA